MTKKKSARYLRSKRSTEPVVTSVSVSFDHYKRIEVRLQKIYSNLSPAQIHWLMYTRHR